MQLLLQNVKGLTFLGHMVCSDHRSLSAVLTATGDSAVMDGDSLRPVIFLLYCPLPSTPNFFFHSNLQTLHSPSFFFIHCSSPIVTLQYLQHLQTVQPVILTGVVTLVPFAKFFFFYLIRIFAFQIHIILSL